MKGRCMKKWAAYAMKTGNGVVFYRKPDRCWIEIISEDRK